MATMIQRAALAIFGWLPIWAAIPMPADAQTYEVLFDLKGGADGAEPMTVLGDPAGVLYGGTATGGVVTPRCYPAGCGVIFKVNQTSETVLYTFKGGKDGSGPGNLIRDSGGNIYGTTYSGGTFSGELWNDNSGTVFRLDPRGKKTVLHSFGGTPGDGTGPTALIRDPEGNFYGVTEFGGTGWGVVFKLDTTGAETVLHTFAGYPTDGGDPSGLVRDAAGNFYGVTSVGGIPSGNAGIVYKLDKDGHETILHAFTGGSDGGDPGGPLLLDSEGNLYGAATYGGAAPQGETSGWGVVFKLDQDGHETVLYTFTGNADGGNPLYGVIADPAGNLYSSTLRGGNKTGTCFPYGCGVISKLDTNGTASVLYTFPSGALGGAPLTLGLAGNLYGTTEATGSAAPHQYGEVFRVDFP